MKRLMSQSWTGLVVVMAAFSATGPVWAAEKAAAPAAASSSAALPRSQWLRSVGDAAQNLDTLHQMLGQISAADRLEFVQRVLKSVSRMPLQPVEKRAQYVKTAIACIGYVPGDDKFKVIAEAAAVTPIEYMPQLTDELAKRFDPKRNGLTMEQFDAIGKKAIDATIERTKGVDDANVRNAFIIAAFTKARGIDGEEKAKAWASSIANDRDRAVTTEMAESATKGDYAPLLAAGEVAPEEVIPPMPLLAEPGMWQTDRLLFEFGAVGNTRTGTDTPIVGAAESDFNSYIATDINRRPNKATNPKPHGYQNQTF